MRVPLTPQDLKPRRGFKQIAKTIKRDWIGASPITLAEAQEMLARCLGYDDYHDVLRESERMQSSAYLPSLQSVRSHSHRVVTTVLTELSHLSNIDDSVLLRYIQSWPLHGLFHYHERDSIAENMPVWRSIQGLPLGLPSQEILVLDAPQDCNETVFGICQSFADTPPLASYRHLNCLTCHSFISANRERPEGIHSS